MSGLSSLWHGSGGVTAYRTASAIRRARRRPPRRLTCRCIPQALPPAPHDSTERGLPESSRYPTSLHPSGGAKHRNPSTVPVQWGRFGKGLGRHAHGAVGKSFLHSTELRRPHGLHRLAGSPAQKLDALEEHGATLEDLNTAIAGLNAAVELGIPAPQRFDAFSALSHALRRRFCRCGASADAIACAQAAHQAVASQPAVPPGALLYYANMLSAVYEVAGDLNALATAASLFDKLARQPGTGAFEPPVAGLAESYLLHYQRAGNANDLDEAFGLTLPVRYTAMDPPPNS